jgi:hypothetical protein
MWDNVNHIPMGDSMQALKVAVIVMGVLIVAGTAALMIGIARRSPSPVGPVAELAVLDEPQGTHIAGIAAVRDRLALQLQGGGVDRVILIDAATGIVAGRISLAR